MTAAAAVLSNPTPAAADSGGTARQGALACGDTITRDTMLHRDLRDCAGNGLVIGADNVTLDLNGHTLAGSGADGTVGVTYTAHHGATIKNGVVRGFQIGILLDHASRTRLRHLELINDTSFAVLLVRAHGNEIEDNRAFHRGAGTGNAGILLFQSNRNEVERNMLFRNGDGISLVQSNDNDIQRNSSSNSGAGIGLFDGSNRNVITRNATNNNSDTGILLDRHADNNRIEGNTASGNAFAGIAVGASDGNRVRRNATDDNLGAGIAVGDNAVGTLVESNQANRNGASPPGCTPDCPLLNDGIHVDAPATTLSRNVANHNADLGIDAVHRVTDGGGNTAHGNGNRLQCTGVVCRPAMP